ncbi:LLM class flavin-dependent oxidoreductase [Nocardia sp. NPDC052278]|uniref:LLM class flavin-dependent oxidoreductase n=1 Tax=unclassified Nocardia TaxID=2637762 RepID=UPI00369F5758
MLPAVAMLSVPGRLAETVALGAEFDAAGFPGLYLPSAGDPVSLCLSLAHATKSITLATSVLPIYRRHPSDLAAAANHVAEISDGRFVLGLGISHAPQRDRLGVRPSSLLGDLRDYLDELTDELSTAGGTPRVALAALGPKMVDLALTRADGLIQANAARSRLPELMAELRDRGRPPGFEVADMIPTVVGADITAARERCRDILLPYVARSRPLAYWREAGYTEEMDVADAARRDGDSARLRAAMTDRWIDDICLCGPASRIREGLAAWFETGIDLPILVPSSLHGGHRTALRQLLDMFS